MPRLAASIWIDAPSDLVFRVVESPSQHLPMPGAITVRRLAPAAGEGARYRWELRRFGLHCGLDSLVTSCEPGRHIAWRAASGWAMTAEVTLWPEGTGTRLIFGMGYSMPASLRWLVPGPLIRLGVWHALHQIKREAEMRPTAPALS